MGIIVLKCGWLDTPPPWGYRQPSKEEYSKLKLLLGGHLTETNPEILTSMAKEASKILLNHPGYVCIILDCGELAGHTKKDAAVIKLGAVIAYLVTEVNRLTNELDMQKGRKELLKPQSGTPIPGYE